MKLIVKIKRNEQQRTSLKSYKLNRKSIFSILLYGLHFRIVNVYKYFTNTTRINV